MELENDKKRYDRTYAQIDLGASLHNIAGEKARVGADVKIMAVIKANAYGHGDIEVAEALDDQVDAYGVAIPEEALKLRKNGVKKMLLILGYSGKDWFEDIIQDSLQLFHGKTAERYRSKYGKVSKDSY